MRAGEEIALEYNQPTLPVPGQPDTEPILRVGSIMQVWFRVCDKGVLLSMYICFSACACCSLLPGGVMQVRNFSSWLYSMTG